MTMDETNGASCGSPLSMRSDWNTEFLNLPLADRDCPRRRKRRNKTKTAIPRASCRLGDEILKAKDPMDSI